MLYNPYYAENPKDCVQSIIEIRHYLIELAQHLADNSLLKAHVRALAAGAREFLDRIGTSESDRDWHLEGVGGSMDFQDGLGRMRAGYGQHLAFIAERFDLEIPNDLQTILPPVVTDDD